MSSISSPYGLRPALHTSGCIRQALGTINPANESTIFQNDPVGIDGSGFLVTVIPTSVITTGAIVGVFAGVEFTATDGRRYVYNNWDGGTGRTDIVAYYTIDADLVYEMQGTASLTQALVGTLFNPSASSGGSTVTGLSNLSATEDAGTGSLRLVGINPGPDNEPGDDFTVGQFTINKHQYAPVQATLTA